MPILSSASSAGHVNKTKADSQRGFSGIAEAWLLVQKMPRYLCIIAEQAVIYLIQPDDTWPTRMAYTIRLYFRDPWMPEADTHS